VCRMPWRFWPTTATKFTKSSRRTAQRPGGRTTPGRRKIKRMKNKHQTESAPPGSLQRMVSLPPIGSKVFGLTKRAEVPEEGAIVKRTIKPDCVYVTTLAGDNIGNRWLDELNAG
jgi:hypothetical protein